MKSRLVSLDVLRGLTIMLMTIVNNPGDWGHVYAPLLHAEWHGCTPTDLVFPTFLFIVGVSVVLASPNKDSGPSAIQKIVTRTLRIFCLGLFLSFWSKINIGDTEGLALLALRLAFTLLIVIALFSEYHPKRQFYVALIVFVSMMIAAFGGFSDFETVRIPGVLQRIAIVYLIISLLYLHSGWQAQALTGLLLLVGYWAIMTLIPVPGMGTPNLDKGTNIAAWLDNLLLPGHLWVTSKTWDPEGILSTLPAIATGIAGLLTGALLRANLSVTEKWRYLFIGGVLGIAAGLAWHVVFPMNKALWTSSFVLYTAGIALAVLAILYFFIDVKGVNGWTKLFVIFGVNPMVVFFFSGIIPRVLSSIKVAHPLDPSQPAMGLQTFLYKFYLEPHFNDPKNASLTYALIYLSFWFLILYILFKRKLIFKV